MHWLLTVLLHEGEVYISSDTIQRACLGLWDIEPTGQKKDYK